MNPVKKPGFRVLIFKAGIILSCDFNATQYSHILFPFEMFTMYRQKKKKPSVYQLKKKNSVHF